MRLANHPIPITIVRVIEAFNNRLNKEMIYSTQYIHSVIINLAAVNLTVDFSCCFNFTIAIMKKPILIC